MAEQVANYYIKNYFLFINLFMCMNTNYLMEKYLNLKNIQKDYFIPLLDLVLKFRSHKKLLMQAVKKFDPERIWFALCFMLLSKISKFCV